MILIMIIIITILGKSQFNNLKCWPVLGQAHPESYPSFQQGRSRSMLPQDTSQEYLNIHVPTYPKCMCISTPNLNNTGWYPGRFVRKFPAISLAAQMVSVNSTVSPVNCVCVLGIRAKDVSPFLPNRSWGQLIQWPNGSKIMTYAFETSIRCRCRMLLTMFPSQFTDVQLFYLFWARYVYI